MKVTVDTYHVVVALDSDAQPIHGCGHQRAGASCGQPATVRVGRGELAAYYCWDDRATVPRFVRVTQQDEGFPIEEAS